MYVISVFGGAQSRCSESHCRQADLAGNRVSGRSDRRPECQHPLMRKPNFIAPFNICVHKCCEYDRLFVLMGSTGLLVEFRFEQLRQLISLYTVLECERLHHSINVIFTHPLKLFGEGGQQGLGENAIMHSPA